MAKTDVEFAAGLDPVTPVPALAKANGLARRFAVIQHTYRSDSVDMVFDEELFVALLRFADAYGPDCQTSVSTAPGGPHSSVVDFLSQWTGLPADEKGPDAFVLVRCGGEIVACINPEHWAAIGGPAPYHDSYTYSVFTRDDIGERLRSFLANCEESQGWNLGQDTIKRSDG
jgi:hypothetical protein